MCFIHAVSAHSSFLLRFTLRLIKVLLEFDLRLCSVLLLFGFTPNSPPETPLVWVFANTVASAASVCLSQALPASHGNHFAPILLAPILLAPSGSRLRVACLGIV